MNYERVMAYDDGLKRKIFGVDVRAISHAALGTHYLQLNKIDEAKLHYIKAMEEMVPLYAQPYYGLGSVYEKTGDIDHAVEFYKVAKEMTI